MKTYPQSSNVHTLTPADTSFVIYDKVYDGSSVETGFGPTVLITDNSAVQTGMLRLPNAWNADLVFELTPNFKEYNFGLYNQPIRTGNAAFLQKFEREKSAFSF